MKAVIVRRRPQHESDAGAGGLVELGGIAVDTEAVEVDDPQFDRSAQRFRRSVLVRVLAFSANFRDRMELIVRLLRGDEEAMAFGSDFLGEVVEVGDEVESVEPGRRVVGDNGYVFDRPEVSYPGLATARASQQYLVLPADKLAPVSPGMPVAVGAGFSVAAQTAFSLLRRLEVDERDRMLITAGRSNTSLAVLEAARHRVASRHVFTTSSRHLHRLAELANEVTAVGAGAAPPPELADRFTVAVDPFVDFYAPRCLAYIAPGARYGTCGLADQLVARPGPGPAFPFAEAIVKNLRVVFNCLGSPEDLRAAISEYQDGRFTIVVDSTFTLGDEQPFAYRCFASGERFGKVIFRWPDAAGE